MNYIKIIQKLVDEIENDLAREYKLEDIVDITNVSQWHFQRVFRDLTGDNFANYLKGRRLTRAAKLLSETDLSITKVAFLTGHSSNSTFARSFKKYFNYSPREFKELNPSITLKVKPFFSQDYLRFLQEEISHEPQIITVPKQIIIGMKMTFQSPFLGYKNYSQKLYSFWEELHERLDEIDDIVKNKYIGISRSLTGSYDDENLEYIAGVEVNSCSQVPKGLIHHIIPEQKVAIFDIKGECNHVLENINYIYGIWLNKSKYERAPGDDYELFDSSYQYNLPESKSQYVVPIIEKK